MSNGNIAAAIVYQGSAAEDERKKLLSSLTRAVYRYGPKSGANDFGMAIVDALRDAVDVATKDEPWRERAIGRCLGVRSTLLCVSSRYQVEEMAEALNCASLLLATRTMGEVSGMREQTEQAIDALKALDV